MILTSEPSSDTKSSSSERNALLRRDSLSSSSAPMGSATEAPAPPYTQTQPANQPRNYTRLHQPMLSAGESVERKRSASRAACVRFTKAFLIAIAIFVVWSLFMGMIRKLAERTVFYPAPAKPSKEDGVIINCTSWTRDQPTDDSHLFQEALSSAPPPFSYQSRFMIPVSSALIYLVSGGKLGSGSVIFELHDEDHTNVIFDIETRYWMSAARSSSDVCLLKRDDDGYGIGLFTPTHRLPRRDYMRQVDFNVAVRFPKSASASHPLVINAFESKLGIWSHHITELEKRVAFKSLTIESENSPIRADWLSASYADFEGSNGAITGTFKVTDSLVLQTTNAPITTDVTMENKDGHSKTRLKMATTNARIKSELTLVDTASRKSSYPASFDIKATSTNQGLDLVFKDAPVSPFSHLSLKGETTNSYSQVQVHPAFEGAVTLSTTNFSPQIFFSETVPDPTHGGRERHVDVKRVYKGHAEAITWWGEDADEGDVRSRGDITLSTTNARAVAKLI